MSQAVNTSEMGTPESSFSCNMRSVRIVQAVLVVIAVVGFAVGTYFPSSRATLRRERGMVQRTSFAERKGSDLIRMACFGVAALAIVATISLHRQSGTRVDIYPHSLVLTRADQTIRLAWDDIRHLTQEPADSTAAEYGFVNLKELPELIAGLGQKPMYVETRDGRRHMLSPALERREELFGQIVRRLKSRPGFTGRA